MTPDQILDIFRSALWIIILVTAILTVPGLIVGLIVAVFQAATQINEQTLSFLPRLLITLATLGLAGPWVGKLIFEFTERLLLDIPLLIG